MAPPLGTAPAPLAPSVEEAYKRKCQQLKRRMNEVEESNDAAYIRVSRLRHEVEKIRLERVFLLDQLAKRTSTNVEDSEGSPSPPSTPKEKPLRSKRGHRKPGVTPSLNTSVAHSNKAANAANNLSPTSDSLSQQQQEAAPRTASPPTTQRQNGTSASASNPPFPTKPEPRKPVGAFDIHRNEVLAHLLETVGEEIAAGRFDTEGDILHSWNELSPSERERFQKSYDMYKSHIENGHDDHEDPLPESQSAKDVEMGDAAGNA